MNYDTVIIGGGLAGLIAAINLTLSGRQCAVFSDGQSTLSFHSGAFELLNRLPDGQIVDNPFEAYSLLSQQMPEHFYSRLHKPLFEKLVKQSRYLLTQMGIAMQGDETLNTLRLTPLGEYRNSWLMFPELASKEDIHSVSQVALVNLAGFMDFAVQSLKVSLNKQGIQVKEYEIQLPVLEKRASSNGLFNAICIARVLDDPQNLQGLAKQLTSQLNDEQMIIMPALLGASDGCVYQTLSDQLGRKVKAVSTFPPSLLGQRIQKKLINYYLSLGGTFVEGVKVIGGEFTDDHLTCIYTQHLRQQPIKAKQFILASGHFVSQGLLAEPNQVIEPLFNLDVVAGLASKKLTHHRFLSQQPYLSYGIYTDSSCRAFKNEKNIKNLYVVGSLLSGCDALFLGCGAGVALLSALHVTNQINAAVEG